MKKILLILLLSFSSPALAEDFRILFEPAGTVDGYVLWEVTDTGPTTVATVGSGDNEVLFSSPFSNAECKTWYMTSFIGELHSIPSNTLHWCKDVEIPIKVERPSTITITLEIM